MTEIYVAVKWVLYVEILMNIILTIAILVLTICIHRPYPRVHYYS